MRAHTTLLLSGLLGLGLAAPPAPCAAPPGTIPAVPEALCYKEIAPTNPSGVSIRSCAFNAHNAAPARCARNCDPNNPNTQPYARQNQQTTRAQQTPPTPRLRLAPPTGPSPRACRARSRQCFPTSPVTTTSSGISYLRELCRSSSRRPGGAPSGQPTWRSARRSSPTPFWCAHRTAAPAAPAATATPYDPNPQRAKGSSSQSPRIDLAREQQPWWHALCRLCFQHDGLPIFGKVRLTHDTAPTRPPAPARFLQTPTSNPTARPIMKHPGGVRSYSKFHTSRRLRG